MTAALRLYAQVFSLGVQNTLVYRWNFLLRCVFSMVPLLGSLYLWNAVFSPGEKVAGYSYHMMIAYFVLLVVLDAITSPTEDDFQIAGDIRDGRINQVLLKPMNYLAYRLTLFGAARLIYTVVSAVPLIICVVLLREHFAGLPFGETWLPGLLAVAGSAALQFMISYCTALLAFWLLEIGSVVFILYSIEFLAGGHVFPLDLLPGGWGKALMTMPFAYEYFFPVAVLLGRVQGTAIWTGLAWQWGWILFFVLLSRVLWKLGLKKYTAVGG